jgi:plastocyanin
LRVNISLLLVAGLLAGCTSGPAAPTQPPSKPNEAARPTDAPKPAASPAAASPSPSPSPATAQGPAPTEDRVGFPENYQTAYKQLFVFDRPDNKQVRVIYGNDVATTSRPGQPWPYGSMLVMETYRAKLDAQGNPELDANGRYQREALAGIFVMRKESGFGAAYQLQRSGEWEYVAFRPDRSYSNPPQATNACAACHQDAGATRDWVFRPSLIFGLESGALPKAPSGLAETGRVPIQHYLFLVDAARIKVGQDVSWSNDDDAVHTVTFADGSFDSGRIGLGATVTRSFDRPGTFEYACTIHPTMKGRVVVQ